MKALFRALTLAAALVALVSCDSEPLAPATSSPAWQDEPLSPMISPRAMCAILSSDDLATVIGAQPPIDTSPQQWGNLPACSWKSGGSVEMRPLDDLTSFTPESIIRTYDTPTGSGRVYWADDGGGGVDLNCSALVTSTLLPEGYEMEVQIRGRVMPELCEAATPLVEKVLRNIMLGGQQ